MSRTNFQNFIDAARELAQVKGINWEFVLDERGIATANTAWNLTEISGYAPPPTFRLSHFHSDRKTLSVLNGVRIESGKEQLESFLLTQDWQDLIKAAVIDRLVRNKNQAQSVASATIRPLVALATVCEDIEPWQLTADLFRQACEVVGKVQETKKILLDLEGVVLWLFDRNSLSNFCPLMRHSRGTQLKKRSSKTTVIRSELSERKRSNQLPSESAFWEVVRIAFTEKPSTFFDKLRFGAIQMLILTGLRGNEATLVRADWSSWKEYFDLHGKPAGDQGGISRSLQLNYFGEKQRVHGYDKVLLYPTVQHIPPMFETPITDLCESVIRVTSPLRARLRAQEDANRIFPEFSHDEFVSLLDIYPRLTGEPFVYLDPERDRLIQKYRENFDVAVLHEIRDRQVHLRDVSPIDNKVRVYFSGKLGSSIHRKAPARYQYGRLMDRIDYQNAYFKIGELEDYLLEVIPTKTSDLARLPLGNSVFVRPSDLLFILPKRPLSEERNNGICDVTRYAFVGRMTLADFDNSLSGVGPTTATIFEKYGKDDDAKHFRLTSHMFRHLQTTELFRLGVADTIITKRFNRTSMAQSYEYDHRSLAEELEDLQVPDTLAPLFNERSLAAYRSISSGKVAGPLVDEFRRIQGIEGDEAAFIYLATEADGFHTTPYGHCLNAFTVEPCPKALECFVGCRHLVATQFPEHRANLVALKARYERLIESAHSHPAPKAGKENMLNHAEVRLKAIEKLLDTEPGTSVFSNGADLSDPIHKPFRGPFSDA